jgi:hypothetical protein
MGLGGLPVANPEHGPAQLHVATIARTNAIIVRGEPDDLQLIEALISRLEQSVDAARKPQPEPNVKKTNP